MSIPETALAIGFLALAMRSARYWWRHRLETTDAVDDLRFAAFVTGRVGTWLLASGMFLLFASIDAQGRAYTDEAKGYRWLVMVFLALGVLQLLGALFLGMRGRMPGRAGVDAAGDEPRPPTDR